jgi:hypothetical protein
MTPKLSAETSVKHRKSHSLNRVISDHTLQAATQAETQNRRSVNKLKTNAPRKVKSITRKHRHETFFKYSSFHHTLKVMGHN